jgi:hypothetical protein
MMGDVNLFERLIAGTLGTTAVLGVGVWLLWTRLNAREGEHAAAMERKDGLITNMVEKVTTAMAALQQAVKENTHATEGLRDAIERGEQGHRGDHRAPRRVSAGD